MSVVVSMCRAQICLSRLLSFVLQIYPDPELEQQILALAIRCIHSEEGCRWTGQMKQLQVSSSHHSCIFPLFFFFFTSFFLGLDLWLWIFVHYRELFWFSSLYSYKNLIQLWQDCNSSSINVFLNEYWILLEYNMNIYLNILFLLLFLPQPLLISCSCKSNSMPCD